MRGQFDPSGDGELRDFRGRTARITSFVGTSAGCLLLLALAGCVSGSDGPLGAENLDQTGAAVSSSALALKEGSPSSGQSLSSAVSTATKDAAASADDPKTTASAPALAMTAGAAESPALAAANSAVAETGERPVSPTLSPHDESGGSDATAETDIAAAPKASDEDEPSVTETASTGANPDEADESASAAGKMQRSPLFRLFSSNRTGKQDRPTRSASPRNSEAASASSEEEQDDEPAASSDNGDPEPTGVDPIEVASVAGHHEQMDSLPGVRLQSLYQFPQSDQEAAGQARIELASAAGMARLAPGFLVKQRESVQTACLKPALLGLLKLVQYHFNAPVVITSGYRGPKHNRRVGGVRHSKHMSCEAADIQVAGVSKWELARYVRALPGRGGVGTYCHTDSVHIDIGEKRDWSWRCRRRK